MQARIVPARQGAAWLVDGWRLFRAAPLGWLAMVFAYWIIMTLASVVPFIGVAAASIMVPAFSVGFMAAARAASRRGPVELSLLFDGFRHQPKSQLILGVIYLMALGTLLSATTLVDDGALASWMLTGRRPAEEALQSDDFLQALAVAALLYTPVLMAFWFAPPLVMLRNMEPVAAMKASFAACLVNIWPMFVYGLVGIVLMIVATIPFGLGWFVLCPVFATSIYASYKDIFGTA